MIKASAVTDAVRRPVVLLGGAGLVVVILVWLFAFFAPQTHRLSSLQAEKTTLEATVVQDNARLQHVRSESHHVGQIQTLDNKLKGYVPASEDLYTYIQTISSAGNRTGITITSLQPSAPAAAPGTSYTAIPITAEVKGTYDDLVAFLNAIYNLPRLTDVNSVNITGGGPGTTRSTPLSATLDLVIFTSQKADSSS